MHAATSFYRPTLPAWENRAPSLRSRAPGDETLRSALVEALDLSQQSLCTTAGHDRLLGLLRGGTGGAVEALTRALVGAIESNNDRPTMSRRACRKGKLHRVPTLLATLFSQGWICV